MSKRNVISFLSAPGGVGKTSLAILLAWYLKQNGESVLLMDLDPSLGLTLNLTDIHDYHKDIEKQKRTSADLLKAGNLNKLKGKTYQDYTTRSRYKNVNLDFIASSIRLEDVMGEIWYGSSLGRSRKLKECVNFIPDDVFEFIVIDLIPCYGLKYALLDLIATDICIVPLRVTPNDLGRTILMMRELEKKASSEIKKQDFQKKLFFLFNMVRKHDESQISNYLKVLLDKFPDAGNFKASITKRVSFNRINTDEEKTGDEKNVKDAFKPFYDEFNKRFA